MKNRKTAFIKYTAVFSAIILVLTMLTGCGGLSGKNAYVNEINKTISGSPVTIDPQVSADDISDEAVILFSATLYRYDSDKQLVPWLAESCDVSEDGLTYTYHLRDDLKWSDGRELTADDFVFGFKRLVDPETGSGAVYLVTDCCQVKNAADINLGKMDKDKLGVSAPDKKTFVVELENCCPYFNSLMTMRSFAPCNEEFFNSCDGNYATSEDTLLSSGPFVVDSYEPLAVQIHFSKNPYFFDAASIEPDAINLQVVSNQQQGIMCYETGMFDITGVSGELQELAEGDDDLKDFSSASLFYLFINYQSAPLQNKNIRIALAKSINRKSLVDNYLKAGYDPMTRINPKGYYMEADGSDFAADQDQYDDYAGYDANSAAEYWKKGLSEIGQSSLTLTYAFESSGRSMDEIIVRDMEKALPGLKIEMHPLSVKEWLAAPTSGKYDLIFNGWVCDYADPTALYNIFITGAHGDYGYSNKAFDEILDKCDDKDVANDPAKRNELLHQAEDILMEDMAGIPIFTRGDAYLIKDCIGGFQLNPTGLGYMVTDIRKEDK